MYVVKFGDKKILKLNTKEQKTVRKKENTYIN